MVNYSLNNQTINIQGLALGNCNPIILFPSGQFEDGESGRDLNAALIQVNAQFGFNVNPHTFNTSWVVRRGNDPKSFHGASGQIPNVGSIIGFSVNNFLVSGEIIHSEYNVDANGGTIVNLNIRDTRRCLDKITIITEDLQDNPGSGIISIARATRLIHGFTDQYGNISEDLFKEYRKILEQGCTYPQILEAIQLAIDQSEIEFDINSIPTQIELEANLGGTASAIRFNFDGSPLTEVITRVLEAAAYDWYWSMSEQKIRLINRKYPFDLKENELLDIVAQLGSASGLDQTTRLSFGDDLVTQPRRVRLLGAHQEGWLNSPILSPLDGINAPESGIVFYSAWDNLSVQFIDAYGILRTYKPTKLELQAALKGIEHWTYFKKYQTAPLNTSIISPGFGLASDAGSIAAQHPDFQSRIDPAQPVASLGGNESGQFRLINNRRDARDNWVLNFYSRVADHANRYFGKAYIASGVLANAGSGAFRLATSAWGNIENQIEGQVLSVVGSSGLFVNDYEINRDLGVLAPFKGSDDKISPYCVLPSGTIYGPEGDDAPAGFGQWTEDYFFAIDPITNAISRGGLTTTDGSIPSASGRRIRNGDHYIPITLTEVGQLSIDPRAPLASFEEYPEGTLLCELPVVAGSGLSNNIIFGNLVTLAEAALEATSSGLNDTIHPAFLLEPYDKLSGVAIPIEFTKRYGMTFPGSWVSGNLLIDCDSETLIIDDQFAPWNFPPQGRSTSIQLMNDRALRRLQGIVAPASSSKFAQIELVGMPKISFDSFSNQSPDASGRIGIRNHGITDINFSLGTNGIITNYRIASFFASFGQDAPLGEKQRAILNGIINPIDTTEFSPLAPTSRIPQRPSAPPSIINIPNRAEVVRRVRIETVNNALTFTDTPLVGSQERYRGKTTQQYDAPPIAFGSLHPDFQTNGGAICVDGFLNIGDEAIYHTNEFRLPGGAREIQRYFSGGRTFSNGTVVFVSGVGSNSSVFDVAIQGTDPLRRLVDVPLLNGAVSVGQLTTLVSEANLSSPRVLKVDNANLTTNGIYLNPGGNSSQPAQIISITNPGTSGAIVTLQKLTSNGDIDTASPVETGIVPIPNPEFVIVGDKGLFLTSSVLNISGATPGEYTVGRYFLSNRQNFLRFS